MPFFMALAPALLHAILVLPPVGELLGTRWEPIAWVPVYPSVEEPGEMGVTLEGRSRSR